MSLTPEKIKALLAAKPKTRKKKGDVDPNVRDIQTWFKLAPRVFGESMDDRPLCDNPNCTDDRPPRKTAMGDLVKMQHTVVIEGTRMCRRCFMAGYALPDEAQERLGV